MNKHETDAQAERARFHRTLARVMTMQLVSLVVLWLLQTAYSP